MSKDENKKEDKKETKPVTFCRKDFRLGTYSTCALGKEIVIVDRCVYTTDDPAEIEFLNNDPEVTDLEKLNESDEEKK